MNLLSPHASLPPLFSPITPGTNRERFAAATHCKLVDRPPVWLMRQAGRCLPEYRALKEKFSFLQLVRTPELAAEVTVQPIRRFDFDAAILFSDILVVPEAMGQRYHFRDSGGIEMEYALQSERDLDRLDPDRIAEKLQYVTDTIRLIKPALKDRTALLGFAGSPWTLANYMIDGASRHDSPQARALFYSEPKLFLKLMEKLTAAVAAFLQLQIDAGVDAVQIFDSAAGLLPGRAFESASACWIREIIARLHGQVPVILFSKGAHDQWTSLVSTGANVLSIDWTQSLSRIRALLPVNIALQGNLDPALLTTTPKAVANQTSLILQEMAGHPGHIFNLGHGVPPTAKLECIEALVSTVRNFA